MKTERGSALAWWAAITILVSAFLLFQVQPIISKKILPWFGGSPAVWSTCVLFFQLVLLGGYGYAHLLTKYVPGNWQGRVHAILLAAAVFGLPILPGDRWKPLDGSEPALRILYLLLATVGPPYFLLSSSGPLVQAWFSRAYPGASPYRLYALSNIGSLAALLTYPFVFEPAFTVNSQGFFWSLSFGVFVILAGSLGIEVSRAVGAGEDDPLEKDAPAVKPEQPEATRAAPNFLTYGVWILLAAIASTALLAVTNHVCEDIAVVPFMWVIPLSLYLLSFIICFDREAWYWRGFVGLGTILLLGVLCLFEQSTAVDNGLLYLQNLRRAEGDKFTELTVPISFSKTMDRWFDFNVHRFQDEVLFVGPLFFGILFLICMLCHGELVKLRPPPKYLTIYYLLISAGGALGGLFVALISPALLPRPYELPACLVAGFILGWIALANQAKATWLARSELLQWSVVFVAVGAVLLVTTALFQQSGRDAERVLIAQRRNFYGSIKVEDVLGKNGQPYIRRLYHGRILHGCQYLGADRLDEPTTYYDNDAGPGVAVRYFEPKPPDGMRVAVVGLGAGTMAAHAKAGDVYRFYDIDPKVIALHDQDHFFTFIDRARERQASVDLVPGDARISLEQELKQGSQNYDVIVLDAFSGDAIPAHLLTEEAVEIYDQQMRHNERGENIGILAVHISNRYLDLEPVVRALARKFKYRTVKVWIADKDDLGDSSSDWILLSRNPDFLRAIPVKALIASNETEMLGKAVKAAREKKFGLEVAMVGGRSPEFFTTKVQVTDHLDLFSLDPAEAQTFGGHLTATALNYNSIYRDPAAAEPPAESTNDRNEEKNDDKKSAPVNPAAEPKKKIADVYMGDHLVEMRKITGPKYDLIILDPMTGDDSLAPLLTLDRLKKYSAHLRVQNGRAGLLMIHLEQKYEQLAPKIRELAQELKLNVAELPYYDGPGPDDVASAWVLLSHDARLIKKIGHEVLWTDQYSNLFEILK